MKEAKQRGKGREWREDGQLRVKVRVRVRVRAGLRVRVRVREWREDGQVSQLTLRSLSPL